ncbi:hypothetical protein ACFL1X_03375 [Candidatus Hydrogenedentota bacterium]
MTQQDAEPAGTCDSGHEEERNEARQRIAFWVLGPWIVAILMCSYILLAQAYAVSAHGSLLPLEILPFFVLLFLGALVAIPISLLCLISKKLRRRACAYLYFSPVFAVLFFGAMYISPRIRMRAFHKLTVRAVPLVQAIHKFENDKGHPPKTLHELTTEYISSIPQTGMGAYPEFRYVSVEDPDKWDNNPWVLYVNTSICINNFDRFIYFPKQNYPEEGYGGVLERVGDWAYVHE